MAKPRILVTRRWPEKVEAKLAERLGYLKETGLDIELLGEQPGERCRYLIGANPTGLM